jgi:hypothetical protein
MWLTLSVFCGLVSGMKGRATLRLIMKELRQALHEQNNEDLKQKAGSTKRDKCLGSYEVFRSGSSLFTGTFGLLCGCSMCKDKHMLQ